MEGQLRPGRQQRGDFTAEAITACTALESLGHDPLLIAYYPRDGLNPYQTLLYQRTWESGMAAVPLAQFDTVDELTAIARIGIPTVLHLHWLNGVLREATSVEEARAARAVFLERLDAYLAVGGRLAWSVHNILPHAARFEEEEALLSSEVVERCAVVHTLATETPSLVAPWFAIPPGKVLNVPHPAYVGAYEDVIAPANARQLLGVMPDERVHVVLGGIRAYKGLARLLDAWDTLAEDGIPRRLIIAGRAADEPGIDEVIERAAFHPTVLLHPTSFEASAVQVYMRAADVAVHAHMRALNSGSLMLAVTFSKRCVVPAGGGLDELVDARFARSFRDEDPASIVTALREAELLDAAAAGVATREIVDRRSPATLAEQFATGLRTALTTSSGSRLGASG